GGAAVPGRADRLPDLGRSAHWALRGGGTGRRVGPHCRRIRGAACPSDGPRRGAVSAPTPRPGILDIRPYVPGKSAFGGRAAAMKLSANESAFGPSPRAVAAYREAAGSLHRYPDGGAILLRAAI